MRQSALFRCDASAVVGSGHVMRCLAFAEALQWAGWACIFATRSPTLGAVPGIRDLGHAIRVVEDDGDLEVSPDIRLVVIDHYGIGAESERTLRAADRLVVAFEDNPDRAHDCDVLLDPTPGREAFAYANWVADNTQLLLGSDYSLVRLDWRREGALTRPRLARGPVVRRILVSMGAGDPYDATSRVLKALRIADLDAEVDVVLGAAAPHPEAVERALGPRMRLHIDPPAMASLAAKADLAIGTPGSSSFERAVLGLPSLLIKAADNQRAIAGAFQHAGAADVLSDRIIDETDVLAQAIRALSDDGARRKAMSEALASLADGRGTMRLLVAIAGQTQLRSGSRVRLRLAERADEDWLLGLQRQPATRRHFRDPTIPSPAEHAAWFAATLGNPERLLMVVETDGARAGMVRLDRMGRSGAGFEISIAIDECRQGEGIGSAALRLVARLAPNAEITAIVNPENRASAAMFATCGYRQIGADRYRYGISQGGETAAPLPPVDEVDRQVSSRRRMT